MINGPTSTPALGVSGQREPLKVLDLLYGRTSVAALWRMDFRETRWEQGDQL